jgi:hypothetical protein
MILTPKEYEELTILYKENERAEDMKRPKPNNCWAAAAKRLEPIVRMCKVLGDIEILEGSPMSDKHPELINSGDLAEPLSIEIFRRVNGYEPRKHIVKSGGDADFYGKGGYIYEVKYCYSSQYRCTPLNPNSPADFVFLITKKAVYKIPFKIAIENETLHAGKQRYLNIDNIPNGESYLSKTYTEIIFGNKKLK